MAHSDRRDGGSVYRVSDAVGEKRAGDSFRDRLRDAWTRVLVDVNRWVVVGALAVLMAVTVFLVGRFGPVSQDAFLLQGVAGGKPYVELQTGTITVVTVVLAINQLVLIPELGPLSQQRERLENVVRHRMEVEELAASVGTPTEPAQFLATVTDATGRQAERLRESVGDTAPETLRREVDDLVEDVSAESERVGDALAAEQFGDVEMLAAAMHFDTSDDTATAHALERAHRESLTEEQRNAFEDLVDALEAFTVSREYFRTLYVRTQFVHFSRAILYTALPALLLAHLNVAVIGPEALPGTTLGTRHLLVYEAVAFPLVVLPVLVIVSYVARLITIAQTSVFVSPFSRSGDRDLDTERAD